MFKIDPDGIDRFCRMHAFEIQAGIKRVALKFFVGIFGLTLHLLGQGRKGFAETLCCMGDNKPSGSRGRVLFVLCSLNASSASVSKAPSDPENALSQRFSSMIS